MSHAVTNSSTVESDSAKPSSRSLPLFVWLTTTTMFALLLLGTLILPQLRIPDEKHHADMVLMVQEGTWIEKGWPGIGERRLDPEIVAASLSLGPREAALRENRATQHPPLFYVTAAYTSSLVTFAVDDPELAVRLWTYRIVSVLASTALPITFYLIASELTTNRWVRLATALMPLVIPGITLRDGPMINTDALLIFLTSLSVLYSVRVTKGDLSKRTGVYLGLSTGLAALTKGHALLVIPVVIAAYVVRLVRGRRWTREWLQSAGISGGIALLAGGWWWIRNLVLHGAIQPVRHLVPVTEPLVFDWFAFDWGAWLREAAERLVGSFWGGGFALGGGRYLGFFWILTVLLILGWLVGWIRSRDRIASSISSGYALALIPAILLTSAFLSAERGRVVGVHGRYFFPALAGIVPLVVLAVASLGRRVTRWLPALFVIGSAVMTFLAIRFMLQQYWYASGHGWIDRWSGVIATSPLPDVLETGVLALTVIAFITLLVVAILTGMRGCSYNDGCSGIEEKSLGYRLASDGHDHFP